MRTVRAIYDFAEMNAVYGATRASQWSQQAASLRIMLADLINAKSDSEVALLKNTSEVLSVIAYGIDWRSGDNVVVGMQEFPSNRVVWESLQKTKSVEVRVANLYASKTPENALIELSDKQTRLIATSSIQYATGYRMDLDMLGQYCRSRDILFCVDAIQSLGASPVDVQNSHIDFLAADAHKWLLAPEGIALFYCKSSHIPDLILTEYGWNMLENHNNYDALYDEPEILKWQARADAKRFECGSLNHLGIYALHASLSLLNEVGIKDIYSRISRNVNYLAEHIDSTRFALLTPDNETRRGGILTIKALKQDTQTLFNRLIANNIFCAYRGGGIRFSPHFYNNNNELDTALKILHRNS